MQDLQISTNTIGTVTIEGTTWFDTTNIMEALDFDYDFEEIEEIITTAQPICVETDEGWKELICIEDLDSYKLLILSPSDRAELFRIWTFAKVFPSIRNYGSYSYDEMDFMGDEKVEDGWKGLEKILNVKFVEINNSGGKKNNG